MEVKKNKLEIKRPESKSSTVYTRKEPPSDIKIYTKQPQIKKIEFKSKEALQHKKPVNNKPNIKKVEIKKPQIKKPTPPKIIKVSKSDRLFRYRVRKLNECLVEYQGTFTPHLPLLNQRIICRKFNQILNYAKLIRFLKALWPLQFVLKLEDPRQAGGHWIFIFCKSLIEIGLENCVKHIKEPNNKTSIYDFVVKDNSEIFEKIRNEFYANLPKQELIEAENPATVQDFSDKVGFELIKDAEEKNI